MTLGREVIDLSAFETVNARIAAVADAQHGVLSIAQLAACGLGSDGVQSRARRGALHRVERGVYALGNRRLPMLGPIAAAVLSCGSDACASHRTAARLRSLRGDGRSVFDVAMVSASGQRGSVFAHSARRLRPRDVSVVDGIPATSVARTLLDCAPGLGRRGTEKMVAEAEHLGVFDLVAVRDVIDHVPGHAGRAILRDAIGDVANASGRTASPPEDELLAAFRAIGLDEPECNQPIVLADGAVVYPDFLWRHGALVVEADPRGTHDRTANYRSDRTRDRKLDAIGLQTMRFNDIELRDPRACAAEVDERLRARREERHDFPRIVNGNS